MELKINISYPDLLALIRQMPSEYLEKLKIDIDKVSEEKKDDTAYLLSNPKNKKYLEISIEQLKKGETVAYNDLD